MYSGIIFHNVMVSVCRMQCSLQRKPLHGLNHRWKDKIRMDVIGGGCKLDLGCDDGAMTAIM
jgi:hypothetical protein